MKAIITAGGLGTRFLPWSKSMPKEMLPVLDKPVIQWVVEEAIEAGIDDIIIVTGREKDAIINHFDRAPGLEATLKARGKEDLIPKFDSVDIFYIRQKEPRGLGDAVYCARKHIGDEPFVLMLGDTITIPGQTKELLKIANNNEFNIVAVEKVLKEDVSRYGIVKLGLADIDACTIIEDVIEKPVPDEAPSEFGITGRYLFNRNIFSCLTEVKPDKNNEIQLTDAIRLLSIWYTVYCTVLPGERIDIGTKEAWMKANIMLAKRHWGF